MPILYLVPPKEKVVPRKRYAFTALVNQASSTPPFIIGRCDEGEPGATPTHLGAETYDGARDIARAKNARPGLSEREATAIVMSTLKGTNGGRR